MLESHSTSPYEVIGWMDDLQSYWERMVKQVKKRQKEMTLEEEQKVEKVEHEKMELEQKTQMSNQLE